MAGKRQHFIPRFLQRGFSIEKNGKFFSCLCKKEFIKENIVIENIGLENNFYALNGDSSVDDKITEKETYIYSKIVRELVNGTFNMDDIGSLSDFVFHMEIRTKNLRSNFTNTASYLIDQMRSRLLSKDALVRYFNKNIICDPLKMDRLINEQLNKLNVPQIFRPHIKVVLFNNIHAWLPDIANELSLQLIPLFDNMVLSGIPEAAKKGHLKGIALDENLKIEEYKKLSYKVINVEQSLILGDCIVVFEVDGDRRFKPFYEKDDILKAIYMPINSNSILYGSKYPDGNLNLENINDIVAQCSTDFFICKKPVNNMNEIQKSIGVNSYLLSNEFVDEILSDLISDNVLFSH
ncbi:DUF4238 domain-containing protein [Erwinia sp. JUb26]|uniref:DUF4238 domain-containing protein n=1 Tax=Erwinia sp. JUb26 TaxID=2485126 RepID=UPI000F49B756|nr:DUF4238 domain-containing protein [Erwinia sp. JUb26]ROR14522.1 uncharacterized protein DUF4238 [Erwinia sp. JUb26]